MPSMDFGLLVAYFVPGFIVLRLLARYFSGLHNLVERVDGREGKIDAVVSLTVVTLVIGMMLSVLRSATVDLSFQVIDMSWVYRLHLADEKVFPAFRKVPRAFPDYLKLADTGRMAAFLEAKANERRIAQFYGNIMLALLAVIFARLYDNLRFASVARKSRHIGLSLGAAFLVMLILYPATRSAYYRYSRAVLGFDQLPMPPAKQ